MEGHAEIEMLRTLKGPSTGEVSVHLVARDSPGSGSHLPAAAFIIPGGHSQGSGEEKHPYTCPSRCGSWGGDDTFHLPVHMHGQIGAGPPGSSVSCLSVYLFAASSATLGLPSSALDVSCFPREQIHVGTSERVAGSVPVTATVLPQLSAGPAASPSASTVRLLEWTEAAAPPSRSGLRVSICEDWGGVQRAAAVGRGLRAWRRGLRRKVGKLAEREDSGGGTWSEGLWGRGLECRPPQTRHLLGPRGVAYGEWVPGAWLAVRRLEKDHAD